MSADNFFNRTNTISSRLHAADPELFTIGFVRKVQRPFQPIVIRPSEIHMMASFPKGIFREILFHRGNYYVVPLDEQTNLYIGLANWNGRLLPACFRKPQIGLNLVDLESIIDDTMEANSPAGADF